MDMVAEIHRKANETNDPSSAGADLLARDIRALRRSRGLTLTELAEQLGRSVGWLSQVERGISIPTISDLRTICTAVDVPISLLFAHEVTDEVERGSIVRAGKRRQLGSNEGRLVEELLSPDLGGEFEMVRSVFAPGAFLEKPQLRDTEEAAYVVSGVFDIEIDGVWHSLVAGDSFRFNHKPHRWKNPGTDDAILIWVIAPPVY